MWIFLILFSGCILEERVSSPQVKGEEVVFRYSSQSARAVSVAGDFNGWEYLETHPRAIKMVKENGIWTARIKLPPGRYQYKFVIDYTTWILDPDNPYTFDDGRGNVNSLVVVK